MSKPVKRLLFWTPRIMCILFAVFVSIFALDVFGAGAGFWRTTLAFLMHMIPTGILVLVLAVPWRWEWIGGIIFPALGVFYIVSMWGRQFPWRVYAMMSGPLFVVGALFLIGWFYRAQLRRSG